MTQSTQEQFYVRLAQYLRDFYADLSPIEDSGTAIERGDTFWSRTTEGTLRLTAVESKSYHQLLSAACTVLAPHEDLSEAAIDTALQDAIFSVVDIPDSRAPNVEDRIREAVGVLRRFIDAPRQAYECWIEVAGIDTASLPATFGTTRFAVVGDADTERLADLVRRTHTVDRAGKLEAVSQMAGELQDRPIAIQRVSARDAPAAQSLATRDVAATIECLNCFADLIPYNRARLRIPNGKSGVGQSLRLVLADDGSFRYSPQATIPWTFSFAALRELSRPVADAVNRVDALLSKENRNPVDELLLRAVRWLGHAMTAGSRGDKFLFLMIALECAVLPEQVKDIAESLSSRTSRILHDSDGDPGRLKREVKRLYDLRSRQVHDGRLEITENDLGQLHGIALETVLDIVTSPDVEQVRALQDLDDYLSNAENWRAC